MRWIAIIAVLMATAGCDATMQRLQRMMASPADQYQEKAKTYEETGELRQALIAWRIAGRMKPDETAVTDHIRRVEKTIARTTDTLYHRGLNLMEAGKPAEARQAFLTVLRLDPGHRHALDWLRIGLEPPRRIVYKVQPGDSFSKIASEQYHDPTKAYAVAYFNDLDPKKPLAIGTVLVLPRLAPIYLYPRSDIADLLANTKDAFDRQQYSRAVTLADKILEEVPGHGEARLLAAQARFAHGMQLQHTGRYQEALAQFKLVPPGFQGRKKALAEINRLIAQQALDKRLDTARAQLERGNQAGTVAITAAILEDHPKHAQARALQNEAAYMLGKSLIEEGQADQAIRWLKMVESTYADTARQLSIARARTKSAAEEHYRNGVKHFINEDLEAAIKEWQLALDLNPDHPKARQDMENAMHLLEKWRELEKTPANPSAPD